MNTPTMPHRGEMITAFLSARQVLRRGIFCRCADHGGFLPPDVPREETARGWWDPMGR